MVKILVVDDDPTIRQLLTDVLELVLDVMMPGMDGYAVLRHIRSEDADVVPVLMLTAAADADSAARGWADGVDYYLAKPFTPDDVISLIDGVLGHQIPVADVRAGASTVSGSGSPQVPGRPADSDHTYHDVANP